MIWTDDRINVLREMWPNPECSGATIAQYLGGLTRSAVIGKAHRLGLAAKPKRKPSIEPDAIDQHRHRSSTSRPRKLAQGLNHIRTVQLPTVDLPFLPPPDMASEPCQIEELRHDRCRWPLWDADEPVKLYCGARDANQMQSRSYCSTHHKVAYGI